MKLSRLQQQQATDWRPRHDDSALASSQPLFEDAQFPANWRSIGSDLRDVLPQPQLLRWLRPAQICSDPKFVSDGTTRFDVRQGALGDCWLLAAVASLSMHPQLFNLVVPQDQAFTDGDYCGAVRFRFWQFGEWTDVVVDDRLPTYNNRLVFMHSTDNNEFWSALLEKAYAKMMGSYEALKGGTTSEAMEDFTGGITEFFDLRNGDCSSVSQLSSVMLQAKARGSLMGCAIEADVDKVEARMGNGLIMGHAYSVTDVQQITTHNSSESGAAAAAQKQMLIRIRNPWGNESEWLGSWSDSSMQWRLVSESEKQRLQLVDRDDGEFWMSIEDFMQHFDKLEVCHLHLDGSSDRHQQQQQQRETSWVKTEHHGRWIRGVSAGGCRKFLETFACNPQFRIRVDDVDGSVDGDDDLQQGCVIVGLMQKHMRRMKSGNKYIGYMMYQLADNDTSTAPKGRRFFVSNRSACRSKSFSNVREITGRHLLAAGHYVIVPSTFDPNEEAQFLLRIFSQRPLNSEEIDLPIQEENDCRVMMPSQPEQQKQQLMQAASALFEQTVAGDVGLSEEEVAFMVNRAFAYNGHIFSNSSISKFMFLCSSSSSSSRTDMLSFTDLCSLWQLLRKCTAVFKACDRDQSGDFSCFELREALSCMDYSFPRKLIEVLALRYATPRGRIGFEDFVLICLQLRRGLQHSCNFAADSAAAAVAADQEIQQKTVAVTLDQLLLTAINF